MLSRIRKAQDNEGGFTLIELLVVMIIIGILAAIAIPVFLSQREKARDTAGRSDVSILGKEVATFYVDGTTVPVLASGAGFYTLDAKQVGRISKDVTLGTNNLATATSANWCVSVVVEQGATDTNFKYDSVGGLSAGACVVA